MKPLGERILDGLFVSVIGMSITIASLIILTLVIWCMSKIIKRVSGKPAAMAGGAGGAGGSVGAGVAVGAGGAGGSGVSGATASGNLSGDEAGGATAATGGGNSSSNSISSGIDDSHAAGAGFAAGASHASNAGSTAEDTPGSKLIAIFAAAIEQVSGVPASSFRIVSYKKTGQRAPVWNLRGRSDYLSGKL